MSSLTLGVYYKSALKTLESAGCETPDLALRRILQERAGIDWSDIIARPEGEITAEQKDLIESDIQRHSRGEPLTRIYGKAEFFGLEFEVNDHVLDPRPDSEILIERMLELYKDSSPKRIIDLGTGSGCLLITALHYFPQAKGVAVDVSADALKMAKCNAQNHNVSERCKFIQTSWLEGIAVEEHDLILSNPPYIRRDVIPDLGESVKNHDPILALDGGDDGLDPYKIIFSHLKNNFSGPFRGLFEIGFDQAKDVSRLAEESRFVVDRIIPDYAGNPRVVDIFSLG